MKKLLVVLICIVLLFTGCVQKGINDNDNTQTAEPEILKIGDTFSLTGVINYSDEPSDIGQEYCSVTIVNKIEYYYNDIYGKQSKWSSDVFFTKGDDTTLLKDYIGSEITISGVFDSESHGIPYITNITITES